MKKVLRKLLVSVFAFFVMPSWADNLLIGKVSMGKKVSTVLFFFFCFIFSISTYGQTGSAGSPFTSLGQARNVTVAGTYYFNIGGTSFSTYVDASGYVLIAVDRQDIAPSPAIPLPSRTALVTTSDGILSIDILSLVTTSTVDEIKFTSLIGDYNALNTNATLITRISNSQSLFTGSNDNALNDDWTGTGSDYLKVDGNSTGLGTPNQLSSIVFHCSGNGNGTHWLPSYNWLQVTNVIGNKAGDIFYLYVRPMVAVDNTVGAASSTPTLCINTALTNITHSTTGATGIGTATGLPAGVNPSWSSNTITISGTPTESGTFNYSIPLTGGSGSVNATGTITVNAGTTPSFTTEPAASVCTNTNVTYTTQSGQTNYTWTIPGTLNTDYSITSGGVGTSSNTVTLKWLTAGSKTVTINYSSANGCAASTATSSTATTTITVVTPVFLTQPSSAALSTCAGAESLNIEVDPGGSSTISSYKWYSNASALNSGGSLLVTNTTTSSTNSYAPTSTAYYYATITNSIGCVGTSTVSGLVTVTPAPSISSQPSSATQSICINGTPTNLSVTAAAGIGSIATYKWYSNTSNSNSGGTLVSTTVGNSTTNSYTPSTSVAGTTYYYCVVTNSNGCSTTSTVSGAITVSSASMGGTATAASAVVSSGGTTTISLSGYTGSIQWQQSADGSTGWTNVSGGSDANSATYTTAALIATTYYKAVVTSGGCAAASSNVITITVSGPSPISGVEVLVVGGGGGGGRAYMGSGAGGGGGQVVTQSGLTVSSDITVTIGDGGSGGTSGTIANGSIYAPNTISRKTPFSGANGGQSSFGTYIAYGGGGSQLATTTSSFNTFNDERGGNSYGSSTSTVYTGGSRSFGNIGSTHYYTGGGGAGSGGNGVNGNNNNSGANGGPGGTGVSSSLQTGSSLYYGGGGGGSGWAPSNSSLEKSQGTGGNGGGGNGVGGSSIGNNGTTNTGGGGGGSGSGNAGAGGSGIVVVRYSGTVPMATGGTITYLTNPNYVVHTFTSSGTFALAGSTPPVSLTTTGVVATVCYNSGSAQMTTLAYTASTGNPTSYSIDWSAAAFTDQNSTSYTFVAGGGSISNIAIPAGLAAGTYTGTMTITNGSSSTTQAISLAVGSASGTISGAGTVTSGTNSTTLTLSGYTGTIQWQSSNNNTSYSNIVSATSATYTATNLTTSTFYKAVVTNGSCASATSAVVTITVAPPSTAFGITGSTTANTMSNNVATVVDPAITVNANGTISGFTVTITNDYTDGDILGFTGTLPYGVNVAAFDVTSRSLYFTGTASAADWQTLLRTVTLTSTSNCYPTSRKVSFLPSNKFYNYFNGHYYEYISTPLSWTAAKSAAASRSFYGRKGYLVTISSESENNYIWKLIAHNSWIGLSCVHTEINSALGYTKFGSTTYGQFYWVTGPEKGKAVSTGLGGSLTAASSVYNNWASGEPNNYKSWGENSGHMFANSGKWNDFRAEGANNGREPIPYIVEYGGSQGDDTSFAASFTRDILITGSPAGSVTGAATVCNGTNSTTLSFSGGGTIQYWEYSTDNFVTPGTTVSSTATSLSVSNLTSSRYYRAVVNTSGCSNLASSSALITVATSTAGSITALSGDVCVGGNAALTLNGNSGDIQKWQVSTSADFTTGVTDISNTTNDLSYPLSSNGTYYFRAAVVNSVCVGGTPVYTEGYPVTVTAGTPPVGGTVNSVDYCGGSNSGTLTLSGATGTSYQWEVSTDGGVVYTDAGNTSTTLNYTGITTTTKYRVLVTSGSCGTTTSSVGTVAVNTAYVDNTISLSSSAGTNAQTTFVNEPISNIRYVTTGATGASFSGLPSGVTGAWANDVITISGTPLNYGSSSYTITLTGGCAASTVTATGTIVVNTRVSTAAVLSGTATICNGTSTNLSVAITDGTGPYTVVYSNGTSNITVTNYTSGANIPITPTATTTYSLVSVSNAYGFAGTGNSGTATITVTPVSVAGTISGAGGTCFGTAKTLTLSGNTGTIQWQVSTTSSSSGFSDISGAAASTYTVSDATAVGTYYYQAVVTNGVCSSATTATVVTVNVIAYPVVSAITGSDNLCLNASTTLSNATAGGVWSTTTPSIATINSTSGLVTGIASGSATLNYTVTNSIAGETNYGSVLLNGTNQSLSLNPGIGTIGTGAFTFECWFKLNSTPSNRSSILGTGTGNYLSINVNSLTEIETDAYGINRLGFTVPTMSVGTWYHLAVVRNSSGVETIFLNGVRSTTGAVTDSKNYNGPSKTIGHWQAGTYFPGNLASIRAVVGSSLYDPTQSSITVPSFPLSSVTNTQLLLLAQSSSTLLTDGSGVQTVTNNNTSTWSSSSPSELSACPTTVTKTVTINPLPVVAPITGNTSICSSSTSQLTSTTTGGVWSSATPNVATVDNTGLVTRIAVGTSIISYTVTNASNCSTTVSTTVTVNALPTPTFTSQAGSIVCVSTDVTYTTESGQSSYVWTVPGTLGTDYSITSGGIGSTSNTVTLKWLTSGSKTVTINYNNASGCSAASATSSTATTVRPIYTTGAIATTGETICYGGTPASTIGSVTASSGGDASITYSWRSSADGYLAAISGATSATYLPPAGLTTTTSYRRYATDGTCNTTPTASTGTWTVTVSQIPTTANAGPDQNVTASGGAISVTLAGNTPSVGKGLWTIVSGTGGNITTPTSPTSTFTGTAGVGYVLKWTISNSPCNASSDEITITSTYYWMGSGGDDLWTTGNNWSAGSAPTGRADIVINLGSPRMNTDYSVEGTLTIEGTGVLIVNAGKTLSISSGGVADFGGKLVTFKSDATGTGQLGIVAGTLTGATNVVVERHIPSGKRAFRFFGSPVATTGNIRDNWMEGATPAMVSGYPYTTTSAYNPNAGYGTHITGSGGNTNGFDESGTNNPSLFTFNNSTGAWAEVTSTASTIGLGNAYRLLIRGNRAYNINGAPTQTATATILRTRGTMSTGTLTSGVQLPALSQVINGWSLVGNPYQSVVDMAGSDVVKTNLTDYYYIWDPRMGTQGAYVAYNYVMNTSANVSSAVNRYVQPGQAFFVQASAAGSAIQFREAGKGAAANQTATFGKNEGKDGYKIEVTQQRNEVTQTGGFASLSMLLYETDSLTTGGTPADATRVLFAATYSNNVDLKDGRKFTNLDETMAVKQNNTLLSMELRALPDTGTLLPLNITQYRATKYTLRVFWDKMLTDSTRRAYLKDKFTAKEYLIDRGGNYIDLAYTITSDAKSSAADRFEVVFRSSANVVTAVTNYSNGDYVRTYPNPVISLMKVEYKLGMQRELTLKVYDMSGRVVLEQKKVKSGDQVNMSQLLRGIYQYQLIYKTGKLLMTDKLLKD